MGRGSGGRSTRGSGRHLDHAATVRLQPNFKSRVPVKRHGQPSRSRDPIKRQGPTHVRSCGNRRRQAGRRDLEEDVLGRDATEPVRPELAEPNAVGNRTVERRPRVVRDDDLTAMARGAHPSGGVDGHPDVVRVADRRIAGVDAHADTHHDVVGPRVGIEPALGGDRRFDRGAGRFEDGEELVSPFLDDAPLEIDGRVALNLAHDPEEFAVPVAEPLEQPCRSLDVAHQHRDESGRHRRGVGGSCLRRALAPNEVGC